MNAVTANPALCRHADVAALQRELARHALWWSLPRGGLQQALPEALAGRLTVHRCGELACATVDTLVPADLAPLQRLCRHVFVNQPGRVDDRFAAGAVLPELVRAGIGLFFRHAAGAAVADARLGRHALIGSLEFLLGDAGRLDRYPRCGPGGARSLGAEPAPRQRAVALLDLVQDFEILRPLLARAAAPGSPFELQVALTDRFATSTMAAKAGQFLEAHDVTAFKAIGPADVANALGRQRSLLVTASESNAVAHAFGHAACKVAPPRTLRVTMQHGYECIGLRHHRAHDLDFPNSARFASDVVLTWDHPDALQNLHPAESHKCIGVGVIKAIAEQAALQAEQRWLAGPQPAVAGDASRLLIAENLHSVRMRSPARHQRFLAFIEAARAHAAVALTIRSHPAGRTLERKSEGDPMQFLDGMLRLEDLLRFDACVSPPSTILLDAVLAGTPAAVWADGAEFGDAAHYPGLPVVTDFADWLALARQDRAAQTLRALDWAVRTSAALNGAPMAWDAICGLAA